MTVYRNVTDRNSTGYTFGYDTNDKISFYGYAPIVQRSGSTQGTFTTTLTQSTGWGFLTSTAGDAAVALLTEIRATLVALGLMKGS